MKLKDILQKEAVIGDITSTDKRSVLEELSLLAHKIYPQLSSTQVLQVLLDREKLGSTGVGNGVAIPHGKVSGLNSIVAVFGRSKKGVEFQAHDNKPVTLFFVLLAPENVVGNHLQALARLSRLLKEEAVRQKLAQVRDDILFEVLISEDEKI